MSRSLLFIVLAFSIAMYLTSALAETSAGELLKDAVDPYNSGEERSRFLRAAGVDSELDQNEFKANGESKKDPFVRPFDNWSGIKKFDRNTSDSIDWFEAEAYRKGLRAAVVKMFDEDGDSRLTGQERSKANLSLAAGKVPSIAGPAKSPTIQNWRYGGNQIQWDTDGDGKMSEEERKVYQQKWKEQAAQRQKEYLEKWDANGDGKVDNDERKASYEEMRKQGEQRRREHMEKWDTDGDGKLSSDEQKAAQAARMEEWKKQNPEGYARYEKQQEEWKKKQAKQIEKFDRNGNGKLDGDEWKAANEERMAEWRKNNPEQAAAYDKRQETFRKQREERERKYDTDGDGKLNNEERQAMYQGQREEWQAKQKKLLEKYDANDNGRLDGDEWKKARDAGEVQTWNYGVQGQGVGGAARPLIIRKQGGQAGGSEGSK